jgi:hypothetical protein
MPNRLIFLVPAIFVLLLASLAFVASASRAEPAGSDCLAKPNSRSGEGQYWYYRIDRSTKRRCWYLGAAGAKVRKTAIPKRSSALRSAAHRASGRETDDAIVRAQPEPAASETATERSEIAAEPTADQHSTDFSTRWPGYVKSVAPHREPELSRNSYADERAASHSPDDMPLVWPILKPAELAVGSQPVQSRLKLPLFLILVAGALALAAVLARCRGLAARQLRRPRPGVQPRSAAKVWHPRQLLQTAGTVAVARKSEAVRKPPAALRRRPNWRELPAAHSIAMGQAVGDLDLSHPLRKPPAQPAEEFGPCDLGRDIEENLRQLLRGWQRVAA